MRSDTTLSVLSDETIEGINTDKKKIKIKIDLLSSHRGVFILNTRVG